MKNSFELLVYGVGQRLKYKALSYSNLSWFLEAKRRNYFKNGRLYDLGDPAIRFEECNCEICRGMMPQDTIDLLLDSKEQVLKRLILHNLLEMKRSLGGR